MAAGAKHDLRCAHCGYGVRVQVVPPRCPMCGGTAWTDAQGRPDVRHESRPRAGRDDLPLGLPAVGASPRARTLERVRADRVSDPTGVPLN